MRNKIIMFTLLLLFLAMTANAASVNAFSATLEVSPESGYTPLTVSYNCYTTGGFGWSSYVMTFGDGSTSTNRQGSKTYTKSGTYNMTCTAVDGLHFQTKATKTIVAEEPVPQTSFESITLNATPQSGDSPLTVQYSCNAIGGMNPVSYVMTFGDGTTSTNKEGTKTYTRDGTYQMKCTAVDALHFTIETVKTIQVSKPQEPTPFTGIDLNINPKEGFAPLTVQYSCEAYGGMNPVSYVVSFGDGTTSTSSSGSKTYTNAGNYKVTCTAVDALHFQISKSDYVNVHENKDLVVSLSVNPQSGYSPLTVQYSCSATGNAPFTYTITFGDGTQTSTESGNKIYTNHGSYQLTCKVTDAKGIAKSVSKTITVNEKNPLIGIYFDMSPNSGSAPLTTSYSCNVIGGISPVTYKINFGDGTSSTQKEGTKIYNNEGYYNATCIAEDAVGQLLSSSVTIDVKKAVVGSPFERIDLFVDPKSGNAPLTVQYSCNAIGGYSPVSYVVSFGDGTTSTNSQGSKTYTQEGEYTIKCTAVDALHNQISAEEKVNVYPMLEELKSEFDVNPKEGYAPLEIEYSCSASGGKSPYNYAINFGDGTGSNDANGKHTYLNAGDYKVSCLVMDSGGEAVSKHIDVKVHPKPAQLNANLNVNPSEGFAPLYVGYYCTGTGGVAPYQYTVSFGDGTAGSRQGTKLYTIPGQYQMTCNVIDSLGTKATSIKTIKVNADLQLNVNLDVNPQSGIAPLKVDYTCSASGNAPFTYHMSLGDGTTSDNPTGSKNYNNAGSYTVECTATDSYGRTNSDSITVNVQQDKHFSSIAFYVDPKEGIAPHEVIYSCIAIGGNYPLSYKITFGDGTESYSSAGNHTYTNSGLYKAKCTATDANGDTISSEQEIKVNAPYNDVDFTSINFNVNPLEGVAPLSVAYSCSVTGGNEHVVIRVDYGNGQESTTYGTMASGQYLYSDPGTYNIVCTATDNDGDIIRSEKTIVVNMPYDDTDFSTITFNVDPAAGYGSLMTSYSCNVTGGNDPIVTRMSYGNGDESITYGRSVSGNYFYNAPGTYTLTCKAEDNDGDSISSQKTVVVHPVDNRDWSIYANPQSGNAPLTVNFGADVSQFDNPIVKWDFKTGHVAYGNTAIHTFPRTGTYDVTASFTDENGVFRQKSVTIVVLKGEEQAVEYDGGIRVTGFIAEIVNGRLYVTANVISETSKNHYDLRVQLMLPELDIYETTTIRTLRAYDGTSVSFIVPVNQTHIDTFAILSVSGKDVYKREIRPLIG